MPTFNKNANVPTSRWSKQKVVIVVYKWASYITSTMTCKMTLLCEVHIKQMKTGIHVDP